MVSRFVTLAALAALAGCGHPSQLPPGRDFAQYVIDRPGASGLSSHSWRPSVCAGVNLRPDYGTLNEGSLVTFLKDQQLGVRVEQQTVAAHKADLVFVFVQVPGSPEPIPLRVAMLPTADEAGRSLTEALPEKGSWHWGVHRSNIAVLGPPGSEEDDLAFAARTKLACWGTFTVTNGKDVFVVPGGYAEP